MTNLAVGLQTGRRRRDRAAILLGATLALVLPLASGRARAASPGPLTFVGALPQRDDLSAIESVGRFLVVASDEGAELRVLEPAGDASTYRVRPDAIRLLTGKGELDIEAMAHAGEWLYVLGSHSLKRPLLDPALDREHNRKRLSEVSDEPLRQRIYRLRLSGRTGDLIEAPQWISLRPMLEQDRILGPFTRIPAAENGVNLEGLAADAERLYFGFRSPVLREGFVPVLPTAWGAASPGEPSFLNLDGRGIRSLERVEGGFLLLARREAGACAGEGIYFWDGQDQLPGAGLQPGRIERLLELEPPPGGATEGLCVTVDSPERFEVVVIHDGVAGGRPLRLSIPRAHSTR